MITLLVSLLALVASEPPVGAQARADAAVPAACMTAPPDLERCAAESQPRSRSHTWAMLGMARKAMDDGDPARAADLYDELHGGVDGPLLRDARVQGARADANRLAGRHEAALTFAAATFRMLEERAGGGGAPQAPLDSDQVFQALIAIVPILHEGDPALFVRARAMFEAQRADDWVRLTNRATVLSMIDEPRAAVAAIDAAILQNPDGWYLHANRCGMASRAGDFDSGIASCLRAMELEPGNASIHASHAFALRLAGRCDEAAQAFAKADAMGYRVPETQRDCPPPPR